MTITFESEMARRKRGGRRVRRRARIKNTINVIKKRKKDEEKE